MTDANTSMAPPGADLSGDALFLDFDGTLVEIAPRPDAIVIDPGLGALLSRLHDRTGGATVLVSGRGRDELAAYLPEFKGPIIGSHGAECRGLPGLLPEAGQIDLPALHARFDRFAGERGLLAEAKPHGAAIHFRLRPEAAEAARAFAEDVLADYPGLALQPAKMAWELRPAGASKDAALRRLESRPPFNTRRPVYLGDDTTDEPALDWAQAAGGMAVKIGEGPSVARWRLPGPAEVRAWLERAAAT